MILILFQYYNLYWYTELWLRYGPLLLIFNIYRVFFLYILQFLWLKSVLLINLFALKINEWFPYQFCDSQMKNSQHLEFYGDFIKYIRCFAFQKLNGNYPSRSEPGFCEYYKTTITSIQKRPLLWLLSLWHAITFAHIQGDQLFPLIKSTPCSYSIREKK